MESDRTAERISLSGYLPESWWQKPDPQAEMIASK